MRGEYVAPTLGRVTVGELGPAWLDRQRGHLKPSGFRSYEGVWRLHVEPRWGHTGCLTSGSPTCRRGSASWGTPRAGDRADVALGAGRILGDAVKDRVLAANPARGVKLPPVVPKRRTST